MWGGGSGFWLEADAGLAGPSGWALCGELYRREGARAFFKGLGPALVRAFPANAACFLGVEVSMKMMNCLW